MPILEGEVRLPSQLEGKGSDFVTGHLGLKMSRTNPEIEQHLVKDEEDSIPARSSEQLPV